VFFEEAHQFLSSRPTASTGMEANLLFVGPKPWESENLLALDRLAELDFSTPQRVGEVWQVAKLVTAPCQNAAVRYDAGLGGE